jgi:hypothetical protein
MPTTISALPPAPSRADPSTFSTKADAFVAALPTFRTQANTLASEVNEYAIGAYNSAAIAIASANFKGAWSSLTGALAVPAAVLHSDKIWLLNTNTSNVTLDTPGVSSKWTDVTSLLGSVTLSGNQTIAGVKTFTDGINVNAASEFTGNLGLTGNLVVSGSTTSATFHGSGANLTDIPLLGIGQSHTDVTASRAFSTIYTNSTSKPIHVSVSLSKTIEDGFATVVGYVGIVGVATITISEGNGTIYVIVPPSATYHVNIISGTMSINSWVELR